ncbi:MAG TPA: LysR family transcriptional regulator [Gammaproteobacteria bacterium]
MELQNLQAFISVSETGSFSKAAEKLFITQPAVSKRISSLEQQLNVRLFDRIGKTVQLTEAGAALLPGSRRILAELEESRRIISNLSGHVSGPLKLGTSHHIGLHRLPEVLRSYIQQYPAVDLDIHFMDSEEALEAVHKGELEIAIATLPEKPLQNLTTEIIWHDPLTIAVGNLHPLAGQKSLKLKDLMIYPAILPSQSTFTRALLEKTFGINTGMLKIAMETNYLETIKMLVSIGLGWSVLPLSMCDDNLIGLDVNGMHMERQLGVAYHQERTLSNAARTLLDELRQHAK